MRIRPPTVTPSRSRGPRVTLTAEEVAEYAGRYGDPSQVFTPAEKCEGLEVSAELLDQPGAWPPVLRPAAAPPSEVALPGR
jgi:hypothetical protein